MARSSSAGDSESRFAAYVQALGAALGHADRVVPRRVQAAHQSLHHLIAKADWSDAAVLAAVRAQLLPVIQQQGGIKAWIIDDTGFPKSRRSGLNATSNTPSPPCACASHANSLAPCPDAPAASEPRNALQS